MMEVYCKFSVAAAAAVLCPPKLQGFARLWMLLIIKYFCCMFGCHP